MGAAARTSSRIDSSVERGCSTRRGGVLCRGAVGASGGGVSKISAEDCRSSSLLVGCMFVSLASAVIVRYFVLRHKLFHIACCKSLIHIESKNVIQ